MPPEGPTPRRHVADSRELLEGRGGDAKTTLRVLQGDVKLECIDAVGSVTGTNAVKG